MWLRVGQKMKAIHIVSDKIEDLRRMQSSKYVQSEIGQCYSEIKTFLKQGRNVVFVEHHARQLV